MVIDAIGGVLTIEKPPMSAYHLPRCAPKRENWQKEETILQPTGGRVYFSSLYET